MLKKFLGATLILCFFALACFGVLEYLRARDAPTKNKAVSTLKNLQDDCAHQRYRSLAQHLSPKGDHPFGAKNKDDAEFRQAVARTCTGISGPWTFDQVAPVQASFFFETKRLVYMSWSEDAHRYIIHTDAKMMHTTD